MAVFTYKARDAGATVRRGTVAADTPRHARNHLRGRGWTVLEVEVTRGPSAPTSDGGGGGTDSGRRPWRRLVPGSRSANQAHLAPLVRQLSTLLAVGIPLLEALDTMAREHAGRPRAIVLLLRDAVAGGASLAEAMRRQPDAFDDMCVHVTEVGENAGDLDAALERLAGFKERQAAMKNRVATALIYPGIVLVMSVAVSVTLMSVVVPGLLQTLAEAGRPLPWPTVVLRAASGFLVDRWWAVLAGLGGTGLAAGAALRTTGGRRAWHRLVLRLPLVGNMVRKQAIVRIATVMSALLRNGVVFVQAVRIAGRSADNLVLRDALARCEAAVTSGREIARALDDTDAFPPSVVQIFAVGQQSGRLEEMLDRLAADYDQQVATASQRLAAVLEPAVILFLVVVVGFIAFATILPMMEAAHVL